VAKNIRLVLVLAMAGALLIVAAGCSGMSVEETFKSGLEEQGLKTSEIAVTMNPHEAQIMMDKMILQSHGITNVSEGSLVHATVKLDNGEEISAVKYDGKVYTYKQ
jgi:hypothetical protein